MSKCFNPQKSNDPQLKPPNLPCIRSEVSNALKLYLNEVGFDIPINNLYNNILEQVDIAILTTILQNTQNNQSQTAKILGINRGTLRAKIQKLGINLNDLTTKNPQSNGLY